MEAIEIGSPQMPLNTVGNSVTFNKKLFLQVGITTAVAVGVYLYYNHQEKQQLRQFINQKKSS
jgi:hypothetical protein